MLLSTLLLAGCSCNKEDEDKRNVSRIQNSSDAILKVGDNDINSYTVLDLYEALVAADAGNKAVANKLVEFIADEVLEMEKDGSEWPARYNTLVKESTDEVKYEWYFGG